MILATRLARKRSASTRMRAHSSGLMLTRRSKRHGSGLQTAFEEKTDFSLLTDLTRAVPHRGPDERRGENGMEMDHLHAIFASHSSRLQPSLCLPAPAPQRPREAMASRWLETGYAAPP